MDEGKNATNAQIDLLVRRRIGQRVGERFPSMRRGALDTKTADAVTMGRRMLLGARQRHGKKAKAALIASPTYHAVMAAFQLAGQTEVILELTEATRLSMGAPDRPLKDRRSADLRGPPIIIRQDEEDDLDG